MKKFFILISAIALAFSLTACDNISSVTEESTEVSTEISLRHIELDSEEGQAVSKAVSNFLDTFISADFEKISAVLHEEDKPFFNFESEEQKSLYKLLFPQISYEFQYVSEYDGVYGIMTTITSPSMADVYGTLITENIDRNISGEMSADNMREQNNIRMQELLRSSDIPKRIEDLYIYVQYINGEYITRCDDFLANELVGGAVEAQSEISDTLSETMQALGE